MNSSVYLLSDKKISNDLFSSPESYEHLVTKFYITSKWLNAFLVSFLSLVGVYGNVASILVFLNKSYSKNTLRFWFIFISFADLFVLILHYMDFTLRSWVNLFGLYKSTFNFVDKCELCCKIVPYFRNVNFYFLISNLYFHFQLKLTRIFVAKVFRTISVYILIFMSVQRNIKLYFPLNRSKWFCSNRYMKRTLCLIVLMALIINLSSPYVNTLVENKPSGEMFCSVDSDHVNLQFKVDIFFVFVTVFIPIILISIFSCILLHKIKTHAPSYYFCFCLYKHRLNLNSLKTVEHHNTHSSDSHIRQVNCLNFSSLIAFI
jgi:hypothetical protein